MDTKITTPKLTNEFRKEVEDPYGDISVEELATRDQAVLLRELRYRIGNVQKDRKHIEAGIVEGKALRMELLGLPKSPYKEECLRALNGQIEASEKQLATLVCSAKMILTLKALEELFEDNG